MDLPAAEAFPLFSAEGERRWVAGWDPCYVHPNEPGAGEGVIFRTTNKGVGTATWIQTRHDPAAGVASFVYMVPDHHAAMVDVQVIPEGEARSRATVKYRMTSLSSAADDFVRAFGEAFDDYLGDWAEAIRRHIVEGVALTATTPTTADDAIHEDDGVPVSRVSPDAPPITSEDVQRALDEWP
ncbi:MAG: hypothetical protein F4137_07650 [Acidobacteria bacterium]|nr:hypothetical protein [Acidobacteriota bacterium]